MGGFGAWPGLVCLGMMGEGGVGLAGRGWGQDGLHHQRCQEQG